MIIRFENTLHPTNIYHKITAVLAKYFDFQSLIGFWGIELRSCRLEDNRALQIKTIKIN